MMKNERKGIVFMRTALTVLMMFYVMSSYGNGNVIDVNTKKKVAPVQKTMYGLFFEDINYAADGGLYGELVKNRSFEFPQSFMGWKVFGNVTLKADGPFPRCPHYVTLSSPGHHAKRTGIQNEGFFGIGVEQGEEYRFSVWARATSGKASVRVQLIDESTMDARQEVAEETLTVGSTEWQRYETVLSPSKTLAKASLRIFLKGEESIDLEHVSLFPVKTFKNRSNGLRRDLAEALADLHPGILRFPGGCIVEGCDLGQRYQWKNTIGAVENRPLNHNRWEHTFDHRYFPDYYQSYGLGFFEFFQLAEDLGAEPLPVLNAGMACQFQNRDDASAHVAVDSLSEYVQDCLDLIEFANGDTTTVWGRQRAAMGHAEPFNLKYLAVGNEQWDTLYFRRLTAFVRAIRSRYPYINIVGTSGPDSEGKMFDIGWEAMRKERADLVDEHFYRPESWFLSQGLRYDTYSRKGPKVFAGEYACHGKGKKWNHYEASLYEAAFMTGMERNADVVHMTSYAPLLAHVEGWQWRPDMIWFDNLRMVKTASYHVQRMFSRNRGTHVVPATMCGKPVAGQEGQHGLFASSVCDAEHGTVIVKVVNTGKVSQPVTLNLLGVRGVRDVETLTLSYDDMDGENTLDAPEKIVPQKGRATCSEDKGNSVIETVVEPMTFRVYVIY